MKIPMNAVTKPLEILLRSNARSVTKYLRPDLRVTVSRQFPMDRRNSGETVLVTWGKPNYAQRKFVKACQRAKEPFPVKRPQIKEWPQKRA